MIFNDISVLNIESSPLFYYENLIKEDNIRGYVIALRYGSVIINRLIECYDYFDELVTRINPKICNKVFLFMIIEIALNKAFESEKINVHEKKFFYRKCVSLTEVLSEKMRNAICLDAKWYFEHTSSIRRDFDNYLRDSIPELSVISIDDNILQETQKILVENRLEILAVKNDKINQYLSNDALLYSENMIELLTDTLSIHGKMFIMFSMMLFNNLSTNVNIDYKYINQAVRIIERFDNGLPLLSDTMGFMRLGNVLVTSESFDYKPHIPEIKTNNEIDEETAYRCETILDHIKYDTDNRYDFDDVLATLYFKRNHIKDVFKVNEAFFAEVDGYMVCPVVDKEMGDSLKIMYEHHGNVVCGNE